MLPIRIKACSESDLRMLGNLARNIQRVLPVTQADIDAAAALGKGWVVWKVIEVTDPIDNLRGGTQLVIKQNSITPGQNVRRVLIVSGPGGETVVIGPGPSPLLLPDAIADSLSYVKAFGGTEQRDIPDNYLQRQFIYMMDGSYLAVTNQSITSDYKIEFDFATTNLSSSLGNYFGARASGVAAGGGFRVTKLSNQGVAMYGFDTTDAYESGANIMAANTRYKYVYENGTCKLSSGGTDILTHTYTVNDTSTITAFGINAYTSNGTTYSASGLGIYCYGLKIWNGQGELVMDLVPAVQKGTVPVVGFYDTVSKTFKTATAGTFAAGGEAVPTPDTPMDIVSNNGVLKYGVLGKNLYDANSNKAFVEENTQYTISLIKTAARVNIAAYDTNDTLLEIVATWSSAQTGAQQTTFTTPENTKYIACASALDLVSNVQIELGSTATEYEPYREGVYADGTVETIEIAGGDNLLVVSTITEDMYIGDSGGIAPNNNSFYSALIPVKPNTKYVFSKSTTVGAGYIRIHGYDENGVWQEMLARSATTSSLTLTCTTNTNTKYIRVSSKLGNDLKVNEIFTATAEMLLKVGDYQDVQSVIDGVVTRNVGVKVLDGTENWSYVAQYSRFVTNIPDMPAATARTLPFITTHYQATYDATTDPGYIYNSGQRQQIMIVDAHTSVEDWTQWLADQYAAGTPVIVIYPLATETTESVAGQTLQVQDGDNTLEITQASLSGLELEAEYEKVA